MKLKIYNQKGLLAGLGLVVLGSLNLYFQLTGPALHGWDLAQSWLIILGCWLAGAVAIRRTTSKQATREDRLDERDERQQLIRLKANDRTLKLLLGVVITGVVVVLAMRGGQLNATLKAMLSGIGLMIGLTFWLWVGSTLYYEHKL